MSRSEKRRTRENRERFRSMATTQLVHARRTSDGIDRALWFIEHKDWQNARETLEECDRLQPGRKNVLQLLLDVYHEQRDYASYCRICPRLIEQDPHNRALHMALATAYQSDLRPAASLLALRRYIASWPDDPLAGLARKMIGSLAQVVDKILTGTPFPADERLELAVLNEEVMSSIASADFDRAILAAEQLLARCPVYLPTMNNLALAYFERGRTDDALAMSRRVLDREPENFHALANIARHLLLSRRRIDADPYFARLRVVQADEPDLWYKKAEAFSYLGDDQAVIDAFNGALRSKTGLSDSSHGAMIYHLAAVAHARLGNFDAAQRHWKKSLEIRPGFELAQENLDDVRQPVALRQGPWPYSVNYWIRSDVMDHMQDELQNGKTDRAESSGAQTFSRIAVRHPEIVGLIPLLLDHGDKVSREFACRFARVLDSLELREALRVFCLSMRGPDSMRGEVANELMQKYVLPVGAVRLWLKGEWQDVDLLGIELTEEPADPAYAHPQTTARLGEAAAALAQRKAGLAERILQRCLSAEGERPELLYNLAVSWQMQGRNEEGNTLFRRIHQRWPDYLFGRTAMAMLAAKDGDFDRAEGFLTDLRRRRRMRHVEFSVLCTTSIQVFMARHKFHEARMWLEIWKKSQPDHPQIAEVEHLLNENAR